MTSPGTSERPSPERPVVVRHLAIGWWSLLVFLTSGIFLEAFHGFKVLAYLDADNATRRLMWRLAHGHGALLSLVHVAFALSLPLLWLEEPAQKRRLRFASRSLTAALVLLPGGFFAAGTLLVRGEPNPAILLVPLGAVLLFVAVATTARSIHVRAPSGFSNRDTP